MRWFKLILMITLALLVFDTMAQKERKYIRQGNRAFDDSNFEESEIAYRKAADVEENKSHKTIFNVGDALYKQKKYEDAINQFNEIAELELSKEEKAKIYHNLGNSLLKSNKLQESIEAYKNALRNNPADMDTKYNLVYAQKKLQEQQEQQQNQDQNKDQNQDQQDNQDQQQNQDQKDQNQNQDQNQQDQQDKNKEQEQQQPKISKEDAQRLLQALENDEKKHNKK